MGQGWLRFAVGLEFRQGLGSIRRYGKCAGYGTGLVRIQAGGQAKDRVRDLVGAYARLRVYAQSIV